MFRFLYRTDSGLSVQLGTIPLHSEFSIGDRDQEMRVMAAIRRGEISDPVEFVTTVGPKRYGLICTIASYGFRTLGHEDRDLNRVEHEKLRATIAQLKHSKAEDFRRNFRLVKR